MTAALPTPLTSLVGRSRDVAEITAMLGREDVRLLTLFGPGGVGKTRLALAVAGAVDAFEDGVAFVRLAPLAHADLVLPAIVRELGVPQGGTPPRDRLISFVGDKPLLLVLDNMEHVAEVATEIADLLSMCPRLTVLATSRVRLRISGEQLYPVPPLGLPPSEGPWERIAEADAVRLFLARARSVHPGFELTETNARPVADICARLDGLPLAIELAAARLSALPPTVLLARLERSLPLLTGGGIDLPERQRTMRAVIAWSYGLLSGEEQRLFGRLAAFRGGFTLEAAEAVVVDGDDLPADPLDGLASLVDKSLLRGDGTHGEAARFLMLETVREYAIELLGEGDDVTVRSRHAAYFLDLARRAEPHLTGHDQVGWLDTLDVELANMRVALDWLAATGRAQDALGMATNLKWFWHRRGHIAEGRAHLDALLAHAPADEDTRAKALAVAGHLARWQQDRGNAKAFCMAALGIFQRLDDPRSQAITLCSLSDIAVDSGDTEAADALAYDALAEARRADDPWAVAMATNQLGNNAAVRLDYEATHRHWVESLDMFRSTADLTYVCWLLGNLGWVSVNLGLLNPAREHFREQLVLARTIRDPWWLTWLVEGCGRLASAHGVTMLGTRFLAAAAGQRERMGLPLRPTVKTIHDRAVESARSLLGAAAFDRAWAEGSAWGLADAVREADGYLNRAGGDETVPALSADGLTPRERDVLRLLVRGMTDRQIAEALFIGPRTVGTHVANLLAKLGAQNRSEAAVIAVRQSLT